LFNELPLDALSSHVEHLHRHYLRYSH
jgi:hypothetical protein